MRDPVQLVHCSSWQAWAHVRARRTAHREPAGGCAQADQAPPKSTLAKKVQALRTRAEMLGFQEQLVLQVRWCWQPAVRGPARVPTALWECESCTAALGRGGKGARPARLSRHPLQKGIKLGLLVSADQAAWPSVGRLAEHTTQGSSFRSRTPSFTFDKIMSRESGGARGWPIRL